MKDYTQVERDNAALTIREYAFGQMNMLRMLGDEDAANNLQEAINMAIAALTCPWVKTADRLPDDDEPVLVTYVGYTDNLPHNDAIAVYAHEITDNYAGAWYWQDSDGVDDNPVSVSITHWMPLPQPPKEESNE